MPSHRCLPCDIAWPNLSRYGSKCPICQEATERSDDDSIRQLDAEQMIARYVATQAKRAQFEEYYAEREAEKFRAQLDSPPVLS